MVAALPATASVVINDPWAPSPLGPEWNVYDIYNTLYGTAYTSSNDLDQVSPDEVFNDDYRFEAVARYAGAAFTEFGYYQPVDGSPVTLTELFTVTANITPDIIMGGGPAATLDLSDPYGLYISAGPTLASATRTWYTQQALNGDGMDHAVLLRVPDGLGGWDPDRFLLVWEDHRASDALQDSDYNDLVIEITRHIVPEPTSFVLVGLGLAGMAARRFRRFFS